MLQIKENFIKIFEYEPIIAFKRNKNRQKIVGTHWIDNGGVKKPLKKDKWTPWSNTRNLCCTQVKTATSF